MNDCLKEPAFYVGDIDDDIDLNLPPTSGEDYIKRVVIEAEGCQNVMVAEIDESKVKQPTVNVKPLPGCIEAPTSLSPSLHWQQCQIADFSDVRLRISGLRSQIDKKSDTWKYISSVTLPDIDDQKGWIELSSAEPGDEHQHCSPTLGMIFAMSHPMVEQVLEYLVEFTEREERIPIQLGRWIYALLVVLEQPLNPDVCSCLRSLARTCSIIRAKMNSDDENRQLSTLNLFICLVARYFRQFDLADSAPNV